MNAEIWRFLAQIIFYPNDLIETIKPFFENLKNENINDQKYIPLLKTFSKDQLKVLYENEIIPKNQKDNVTVNNINSKIEEILSEDKIKELEKLLQEKDIKTFNMITKSFL